MKVVLFCGGLGMRIREAFDKVPKPLIPIGSRPILWHVMQYYAHFGHKDFILCLGYGGDAIQAYFAANPDSSRVNEGRGTGSEDWRITFADTGTFSSIGERLCRVKEHLWGEETFLASYADGLTDLHLPDLVDFFATSGKVGCFLCPKPVLSYHFVRTREDGTVVNFEEAGDLELRINGGFFVFRNTIFDYIRAGEDLVNEPFRRLVGEAGLGGYRYDGFWRTMDTFKDRQNLEDLQAAGDAPWEVWKRNSSGLKGD
jgi:glucose-1-phosphate cytidylyltransferase